MKPLHTAKRTFTVTAIISAILIVLSTSAIPLSRVETAYEVSAVPVEGSDDVYIDWNVDHARVINNSPDFEDNFTNSTSLTTTWDQEVNAAGHEKTNGYYHSEVSTTTTNVTEWINLTGDDGANFEMMYKADVKKADDLFFMQIENTAGDYIRAGNFYNKFYCSYQDYAGTQRWDNTTGFEEDTWYVVQIEITSNGSTAIDFRYKSNFSRVIDQKTIGASTCNLSNASDIEQTTINNTGSGGHAENDYLVEYFFATDQEAGTIAPTSTSSSFSSSRAKEKKEVWSPAKNIDVEAGDILNDMYDGNETNARLNATGGSNMTSALNEAQSWTLPSRQSDLYQNKSDDSTWDLDNLGEIAQMESEFNSSHEDNTEHREIWAWDFTDGKTLEYAFKDKIKSQFVDDDDDDTDNYYVVSYRLNNATLVFDYSDDFKDKVLSDFSDGIRSSSADVEAWFWDDTVNSIKGGGSDALAATQDGLSSVQKGTVGFFGAVGGEGSDIVKSSLAGLSGSLEDSLGNGLAATNALIGNALHDGGKMLLDLSGSITRGAINGFEDGFNVLFGGTMGKIMLIVIVVIIVLVIAALYFRGYLDSLIAIAKGGEDTARGAVKRGR